MNKVIETTYFLSYIKEGRVRFSLVYLLIEHSQKRFGVHAPIPSFTNTRKQNYHKKCCTNSFDICRKNKKNQEKKKKKTNMKNKI